MTTNTIVTQTLAFWQDVIGFLYIVRYEFFLYIFTPVKLRFVAKTDEKLLTNNLPPAYDDATSVMLTEGVKKNGIQAHKLKGRNILP